MSDTSKIHKRKRSLQDSPVDLSQMQLARRQVERLRQELEGIEETEKEMKEIMTHIDKLERILTQSKKQKYSFSSLGRKEMVLMGIKRGSLCFNKSITPIIDPEHLDRLCMEVNRIYRHVSMKTGARMMLDQILLTIADIICRENPSYFAAILPELRLAVGDGVMIKNNQTQTEFWLTGNTDYGICTFTDAETREIIFTGALADILPFLVGQLVLIETKKEVETLMDYLPEATGQAIVMSEATQGSVRFCLSNGQQWMFCLYNKTERVVYFSSVITLGQPLSNQKLQNLVDLIYHLITDTADLLQNPLYTLTLFPEHLALLW
ncbi:hypothetical protein ABKN59_011265 [Abortiporus biennis]